MATQITCPHCSNQFEASEALEQSINNKYREQYNQKWKEQKAEQDKQIATERKALNQQLAKLAEAEAAHLAEVKRQVEAQCKEREKEMKAELSKKLTGDYEDKLRHLEETNASRDAQLKEARQKELDFLRREEALNQKAADLEVEKQRAIRDERTRIAEEIRQQSDARDRERQQEFAMKQKEWELRFEQQQRALKEAQQKAEQGSMQVQGEVQELVLEALLRQAFPFDLVQEVGKGVRGADCILTVRNSFMQECGCIIFESKRTVAFANEWIDKLKGDMVNCQAEIAVIVTQAMPKDMTQYGERQGVYICTFAEVRALVAVLRNAILKIHETRKGQENKADKAVSLYNYLTGAEFMAQWDAMRDAFRLFRSTLQKERDDFDRAFRRKEKLLTTIIQNSMQISGSIEGISGMESMNWIDVPDETIMIE